MQRSLRASQVAQVAPGAPQVVVVWDARGTQEAPLQHPPGHEAAVQAQVPPVHVCPFAHGAPAPHRQTPFVHVLVEPEQEPHAAPAVPHWAAV